MHKVIYDPDIVNFARPLSIKSSYQELLMQKGVDEEIVVIFELGGQKGYMTISTFADFNWYLCGFRHDFPRTPEKFFWVVNQMYLDMNRS